MNLQKEVSPSNTEVLPRYRGPPESLLQSPPAASLPRLAIGQTTAMCEARRVEGWSLAGPHCRFLHVYFSGNVTDSLPIEQFWPGVRWLA